MTRQARIATAKSCIDAMLVSDSAGLSECLAPDIVMIPPLPSYDRLRLIGRDNVVRGLISMCEAEYTSPRADYLNVVADENTVVIEWIISATIRSSGAPYKNWYCFIFAFEGDLIGEIREYADTAYGERSLGTLPADTITRMANRND